MARIPRKLQVRQGYSVHKVWRGHNKEWNLETPLEKSKYLEFLNQDLESKDRDPGSILQALTLMANHPHEVSKILSQLLFSNHMRRVHSRYGQFFNKLRNRTGAVAEGRPHTTLLGDARHEMTAVFYVHANPVRARIVADARNYYWTTHRLYAFGKREPWMRNVQLPDWYKALGRDSLSRQRTYRRLFERYLKESGLRKQQIFDRCFFGPVEWSQKLEKEIKVWRRESREPPNEPPTEAVSEEKSQE